MVSNFHSHFFIVTRPCPIRHSYTIGPPLYLSSNRNIYIAKMVTGLEIKASPSKILETDDDGRPRRTGNLATATAHIITTVIGSGVLSLAWATAQLGWIGGPVALLMFSLITWFASCLLADCYRFPGPVFGTRNYAYMTAVKAHLGGISYKLCGVAQYTNLIVASIGYMIASAISMAAIKRSNCFHRQGHDAGCHTSNNMFLVIFGITEIIISQVPNFHELAGLSIVAAIMSFSYSSIGLGLSIARVVSGNHVTTSLTGATVGEDVTAAEKAWFTLQALGNIACAYTFSLVLIEIQDTLKPSPPENQVMKKASLIGVSITTMFYMLCGVFGYAAFGNRAPGNFLTGFGFYEPYWLVDLGNLCVIIHLLGAYQVFCQPVFGLVEDWSSKRWPESKAINNEYRMAIPFLGVCRLNSFRLVWRTTFVVLSTTVAMIFPFFNSVFGLIGASSFWPLTVHFPVEMHISQAKIRRWSFNWICLRILSLTCLIVSLLAVIASVEGLISDVLKYKPFKFVS